LISAVASGGDLGDHESEQLSIITRKIGIIPALHTGKVPAFAPEMEYWSP
jgi:hypothetical protein